MATEPSQQDDRIFEDEVRRFARLLYLGNDNRGAALIDERERDGIFITDDLVVAIEATRSTRKIKASQDVTKLRSLVGKLAGQYPDKAIRGFFITEQEPTADQRQVTEKAAPQVSAMSFATFQARLVDARLYVSDRKRYFFGSALDPVSQTAEVSGDYIPLELIETSKKRTTYNIDQIRGLLRSGKRIVLQGEYGIGKSMTCREVFLRDTRDLLSNRSQRFSIYLNLRDHQGQTDPTEALDRHSRRIGFPNSSQLVRAWRSGRASLILDGFDEITTSSWPGKVGSLSDVRRRSVRLVKSFVEETPMESGVLLAGRSHFFDSPAEMLTSLGLRADVLVLSASDFSSAQIQQYLASHQWTEFIPNWLPPRPLLVGHLASRGVLEDVKDIGNVDPAVGWDYLADVLTQRETRVDVGIDGLAVRQILERLATRARKTISGLGPLTFDEVIDTFQDVCSYPPDPEAYILLQRLPGLQIYESAQNSRMLIDDDLSDVWRAGDVARFAANPHHQSMDLYSYWENLLGDVGVSVLAHLLEKQGTSASAAAASLTRLSNDEKFQGLSADLLRSILLSGHPVSATLTLKSLHIPTLELIGSASAGNVLLVDCIIDLLDVSEAEDASVLPRMTGCDIDRVEGAAGLDSLTAERFEDCTFGTFSESTANLSSILSLAVSDYRRVMLGVLQKIFARRGRGRKEGALYRGALSEAQRKLVGVVLERLQSELVAMPSRRHASTLWTPNRAMVRRVMQILDNPTTSPDPLLEPR